jgi:hypothetical protein
MCESFNLAVRDASVALEPDHDLDETRQFRECELLSD